MVAGRVVWVLDGVGIVSRCGVHWWLVWCVCVFRCSVVAGSVVRVLDGARVCPGVVWVGGWCMCLG